MNRKNTLGLVRNAPFSHSVSDPSESRSAGLQIFRKVIPWELLWKICRLNYRSEIKLPGLLRNSEFRNSASDRRKVVPLDPKICGRKVQKMGNLRAEWFVNLSEPGLPIWESRSKKRGELGIEPRASRIFEKSTTQSENHTTRPHALLLLDLVVVWGKKYS